ncbi:acyl carrier protein [Acaryochloris marina]|uniref:acyl carrier protein n=1 Tax=Acaryochloris marina TaxID=155978 RepID=UPI001BB088A4|nr:acyl carrier protein [Acaryochloris marina]QUY44847.1 acyl carrier protein [Acaryochloris marina S15]
MTYSPEKLTEKIKSVILDLIPIDEDKLLDNSDIFNLGLDSINAMTLVFNLQDTFSIKFEVLEIDVENFRSVKDISKLIRSKL